jgi:SAM-dependent methyltransferase
VDSHEVREAWADRSGAYSPTYYAHRGADDTSLTLADLLAEHVGTDAAVCELGCSAGRHLAHLHDAGFTDLTGVELNADSFDVMRDTYPDLADAGTFHHAAIEDVLADLPDDHFDAVYSVETLQHVHPDESWVFGAIARVASTLVVTVENEGEDGDGVNYVDGEFPLYYRDWADVFTDLGCEQLRVAPGARDTLRAFRTP